VRCSFPAQIGSVTASTCGLPPRRSCSTRSTTTTSGKLSRLASVADNLTAKRAMRDRGERELNVQLSLEDESTIIGAYVTWPEIGLGVIEEVEFALLGTGA
jgi:hypothetical protein